MSEKEKVGLFFGSFNPIHIGHLIVANAMVETTDLNKIWFVVSPQNPLKPSKGLLHEFDRYDMVQAAVGDNFKFEASDIELRLPKPSYTSVTLVHLNEKFPNKQFVVIVGEDNLDNFQHWKNYEAILNQYGLYVYPRPRSTNSKLKDHHNVRMVPSPLLDISATYIRERVRNNQSIRYLVPEVVESMIQSKGFYKS
ncbi:MAG: nicotinate-nucleotide adenylyltransferase [Flammeovirgaceae bacterium]|nr:nicotinate-nucleotide adenylyltransferase [Flammeovirgaceae bacterium]